MGKLTDEKPYYKEVKLYKKLKYISLNTSSCPLKYRHHQNQMVTPSFISSSVLTLGYYKQILCYLPTVLVQGTVVAPIFKLALTTKIS
jgi:hypothetical protein